MIKHRSCIGSKLNTFCCSLVSLVRVSSMFPREYTPLQTEERSNEDVYMIVGASCGSSIFELPNSIVYSTRRDANKLRRLIISFFFFAKTQKVCVSIH
jgi:hypothetical protein